MGLGMGVASLYTSLRVANMVPVDLRFYGVVKFRGSMYECVVL